jgi:hypothetical protein
MYVHQQTFRNTYENRSHTALPLAFRTALPIVAWWKPNGIPLDPIFKNDW